MSRTLEEILENKKTITVNGQKVDLQTGRLVFNEANLSKYTENEGAWYDYFGNVLADAEVEYQNQELLVDKLTADKFIAAKEDGASDKLAESKAKQNPEVEAAKKLAIEYKGNVKMLQQHLKAWDKNHENAQSRGHMLRKEIDKLNTDIYYKKNSMDDKIDDIIGKASDDE